MEEHRTNGAVKAELIAMDPVVDVEELKRMLSETRSPAGVRQLLLDGPLYQTVVLPCDVR